MSTMLRDNNFLGRKSAFILILALIFVFFTSCSNIGIFQNGGLVIAVPGSRSASESTIFTVTVADAAGNKQNKTVVAGESAQFDDLVPGPYSISVEGKESYISTMYGVAEVSVAAGKTATASIALSTVAHSLKALQMLIEKGGTVYIGSDISVDSSLSIIKNEVHLVALKDVVLTNNADAPGLIVQESKVTLGGGDEDTKDTSWRFGDGAGDLCPSTGFYAGNGKSWAVGRYLAATGFDSSGYSAAKKLCVCKRDSRSNWADRRNPCSVFLGGGRGSHLRKDLPGKLA